MRKMGGYRTEFEPAEDIDLFLRLAEVGRLANLPEVLLNYRFNPAGTSLTRMEIQSRKLQIAVGEARSRRGLPELIDNAKGRQFSRCRYEGSIICHSFGSGHVLTTLKHLLIFAHYLFWTRLCNKNKLVGGKSGRIAL
jgi:hypothetical protein